MFVPVDVDNRTSKFDAKDARHVSSAEARRMMREIGKTYRFVYDPIPPEVVGVLTHNRGALPENLDERAAVLYVAHSRGAGNYDGGPPGNVVDLQLLSLGSGRWVQQNCPTVLMSHKLCASFLATPVGHSAADFMVAPARSFVVVVPNGLLQNERGGECTNILTYVTKTNDGEDRWQLMMVFDDGSSLWSYGLDNSKLLEEDLKFGTQLGEPMSDRDKRLQSMGRRLVANVCLAVAAKGGDGSGIKKRVDKSGGVTNIRIESKVDVDARPMIKEYVAEGTSYLFQSMCMVVGHWRNQACGPQHSLRKITWVQAHERKTMRAIGR